MISLHLCLWSALEFSLTDAQALRRFSATSTVEISLCTVSSETEADCAGNTTCGFFSLSSSAGKGLLRSLSKVPLFSMASFISLTFLSLFDGELSETEFLLLNSIISALYLSISRSISLLSISKPPFTISAYSEMKILLQKMRLTRR